MTSGIAVGRKGFTILELITTLSLVVIILGLAVSLARYVRTNSADQVTRKVLVELEQALQAYRKLDVQHRQYPPAAIVPDDVSEDQLNTILLENNKQLVELLRKSLSPQENASAGAQVLKSVEGGSVARDAWGRVIGYLPHQHPQIGMANQNAPFFFSAGIDGKYFTRQDNLYSYEQPQLYEPVPLPKGTGHRE